MRYTFLIIILALLSSCNVDFLIDLENTSDIALNQKSIELKRENLEKLYGNLPEQEVVELKTKDGSSYLGQLDDLDGDGKWDVLFTQVDFKANEEVHLNLNLDVEKEIVAKTNIRFADKNDTSMEFTSHERLKGTNTSVTQKYFQFEGPGWENDVVAFRNYFDERNGIDIFGKRTTEMALDRCGTKGVPSYHELQPWGMDILKVGNSLGAGALALQTKSGLYRIGPDSDAGMKVLVEGPIRSIIEFYFKNISIDEQKVKVTHRVIIEAGKPYYNSQVWVKGLDDAQIVTGIVNLHSDSVFSDSQDDFAYFYTHDNQAYDGEKLGMAIMVGTSQVNVSAAPEEGEGIIQTFYTALPIDEQPIEFYFMVGWEKQDESYATKAGFESAIVEQANQLFATIEKTVEIKGTIE